MGSFTQSAKSRQVQGRLSQIGPRVRRSRDSIQRPQGPRSQETGLGQLPKPLIACIEPALWGHVAEWLRNGLQNRELRFNSGRGLHFPFPPEFVQNGRS